MTKRLTITLVALILFVMLAVLPVAAVPFNLTNIGASVGQVGKTVFIGESGLNLQPALLGELARDGDPPVR